MGCAVLRVVLWCFHAAPVVQFGNVLRLVAQHFWAESLRSFETCTVAVKIASRMQEQKKKKKRDETIKLLAIKLDLFPVSTVFVCTWPPLEHQILIK